MGLWEPGNKEPIGGFSMLDSMAGVCMPFWDEGSNCLYLAGKGDGNIRYFEYANDKFEFLSEYKSADPQRGIAFVPRRGINVHENEVMRAYKTVNDAYIEPISFTVPRRAETFQADIFPPATGQKPAMSAKQWFDGQTSLPAKIDLESIYDGTAPKEVPADYKPPAAAAPPPAAKPAPVKEEPKEEPKAAATARGPPPTMNEQKSSISTMANKFQDNEEDEEDEDETSSFEEITRPAQRGSMPIRSEPKAASPTKTQPPAPAPVKAPSPTKSSPVAAMPTPAAASSPVSTESSLDQIKHLIENQTKIISAQNDKIGQLASEVDALKKKVGSGSQDQSERIRQLELELEEARS